MESLQMPLFFSHLLEAFHVAVYSLLRNKLRSFLATLGIIIGVLSVTLMGAVIEGLSRAFERSFALLGADVLYIEKTPWFGRDDPRSYRNRKDIKLEYVGALQEQARFVRAVSPEIKTVMSMEYKGAAIPNVQVIGSTDQLNQIGGFSISLGRFITEEEAASARSVCIIGSQIAEELFPRESPLGKEVSIGGTRYRVVGVLEKQGKFLGMLDLDKRVIIPIKLFLQKYGSSKGLSIAVKAANMEMIEEAKEEVRGILRRLRKITPGAPDDFAINQREELLQASRSITAIIGGVGLFITGLSLFVGGISVMNIMLVSVAERTREIGIRKAVGAKRRSILLQFLVEAVAICTIGGIVGFAAAIPSSLLIDQVLPTAISPLLLVIALTVSAGVGITSGFVPAYRASNLNPVEALRYE